jgi:hypothetical protein
VREGGPKKLIDGVRLLLFHPGVAGIDCEDCKKYVYDLKTGERKTYRAGPGRIELPCVRPALLSTPCGECPKKSPENARLIKLNRRNLETVWIYRQVRATGGQCLTEAMAADPLLMRNLTLLDELYREHDRERLGQEVAHAVLLLYAGKA